VSILFGQAHAHPSSDQAATSTSAALLALRAERDKPAEDTRRVREVVKLELVGAIERER
jgi:hypothetical protein